MKNITTTFPYPPYSDNFDVDQNLHKVMFKAGSSFTHYHLNLLQSILQEQIAIFGRHLYKNGSFITPAQYKIVQTSNVYDITQFTNIQNIKETLQSLVNSELVDLNNKTYKVLFTQETSSAFNKGELNKIVLETSIDNNTVLSIKNNLQQTLTLTKSQLTSYIVFEPSIIFLNGYFLNFPKQFALLPSNSSSVGFEIQQSIITAGQDSSLLDNASGFPSEGSEGADRYYIFPKLIAYPVVQDSNYYDIVLKNEFIEYIRIENSVVTKDVTRPIYDEFAKTLARRTFDTSGNYTIDPFQIDIQDKDNDYFLINIKRGKAYIFGYEFDSLSTRSVLLPKSTTKFSQDDQITIFPSFSYVKIPTLSYFIDIQRSERVLFYNNQNEYIGSGSCFYVEQSTGDTKLYLTNVQIRTENSIEDVVVIKNYNNVYLSGVTELVFQRNIVDSFFVKPQTISSIEEYSNLFCVYQKTYFDISDNYIIKESSETFSEELSSYFAFDSDKNKVIIKSIAINQIDNLVSFDTDVPISYLIAGNISGKISTATYTQLEKTSSYIYDGSVILIEDKVLQIKDIRLNSVSILSQFNVSEYSSSVFNSGTLLSYIGLTDIVGRTLNITYSYAGNFSGQVFQENGICDFRKNNFLSIPSIKPQSKIKYSFTKSLSRFDKLVLTANKTFELIHGTPDLQPIPPKDRQDAMTLYTLFVPDNITLPSSIGIKYVENKRYTMRDIGKLDKRIENLEFYTALNLLEKQTAEQSFPDSSGNTRFKNGFLVDNFKTFKAVSLDSKDAHFSLDTEKGLMRPSFAMKNLDLVFDENQSSTVLTGDLITLPYKEVPLIQQLDASDVMPINSFSVFVYEGKMKLTPETDCWVDTETAPTVNLNQYGETDVYASLGEKGFNSQWGSWESNILSVKPTESKNANTVVNFADVDAKLEKRLWNPSVDANVDKVTIDTYDLWVASGFKEGFTQTKPDGNINEKPAIFLNFKDQQKVSTQNSTTFQQSQLITNQLSNNVTDIAISPYQRAISIRFDVTCLKPLTKFFVLFDNVDVSKLAYVFGSKETGDLISNEFGELRGVVDLPAKQFKTGSHQLKLVDTLATNNSMISSFASSQFFSNGLTQTKTLTLISTREPVTIFTEKLFNEITAVFDTSVLKRTHKITLDLQGDASVEIQSESGKIVLSGKANSSVSTMVPDGDVLNFYMTETSQKLTSFKGLPYFDKDVNATYSYVCKDVLPKEDMTVVLKFDEPKIVKVKVKLNNIGDNFKQRPFPYFAIKAQTFNSGIIETTLQYKESLLPATVALTPTPTPTINPTPTPTKTVSPQPGFTLTPTVTPTVSPSLTPNLSSTPTLTPSPTPTPYISPTPSATLMKFEELKFDYSIITNNTIETKEFELVVGDVLECNFVSQGLPVTNFISDSSNPLFNWDKQSTSSSVFIRITEENIITAGQDQITLFLNPIDNKAVKFSFRSFGNDITLKWIITDNISSSTISASGFIIVPASSKWVSFDSELLDIPGKELGYLRLIPADERSRIGVKKTAKISYQAETLQILPQSPAIILDEVYSGKDEDYLTPSKIGTNIKTLENSGSMISFNTSTKKLSKEFFIDLESLILQTPLPTPTPSHSSITPTPSPTRSPRPLATPSPTPVYAKGTYVETKGIVLDGGSVVAHDPLAESFFIDATTYPEGVVLSSVDLFFWKKDFTLPVTVELRQSVNSYPSAKEIIPFSIKTLSAEQVKVSDDATIATNFKFISPVFLLPGQYHLVVITDSPNYQLWIGTLGKFKVGKQDDRISKNPYSGVLFRSSNNTAWLPQSESDLTFRMNRCSFSLSGIASINNVPYYSNSDVVAESFNYTTLRLNAVTVLPDKTSFSNSVANLVTSDNNKKTINIQLNASNELDFVYQIKDSKFTNTLPTLSTQINFQSNKEYISPIIDTQRLSSVLVCNIINKLNNELDLTSELKSYGGVALAKYITKKVSLNLEIPANTLKVSFAASLPKGTQIRTYYRVFNTVEDSSDFTIFDRPWQFLGLASKTSNSKDKFIDFSIETNPFVYEGNTGIKDFDTYMIKLVLESENPANVPFVKDFRVIALTS